MKRFKCLRCEGLGCNTDGDRCLHCDGTGCVPYRIAEADRFSVLCETVASRTVMRRKDCANNDPEGWGFHATKNMMNEHEYTQARIWDEIGIVECELKGLGESTLSTLCDMAGIDMPPCVDEDGDETESKQVVLPMSTSHDEDVPFGTKKTKDNRHRQGTTGTIVLTETEETEGNDNTAHVSTNHSDTTRR